ncbi:MAG: 50S ribosomal protein L30 [Chlorobiales bacterium]|jgi:large subunit ribosomal protein L30|nr:50S ribosomal protein L30 [Chlorobiales bacterium]
MPETAKNKLKITQVRSIIGSTKNQKDTIKALGLGRPTYFKIHTDSPILRGQLEVVGHLIKVEEVK